LLDVVCLESFGVEMNGSKILTIALNSGPLLWC